MTPVFKWSGEYFGFIHNENLFHANGAYFGWIEDGRVWASHGAYLGDLVDGSYILRRINMIPPLPKIPRPPRDQAMRPIQEIRRSGQLPKNGWVDGLEGLTQTYSRRA